MKDMHALAVNLRQLSGLLYGLAFLATLGWGWMFAETVTAEQVDALDAILIALYVLVMWVGVVWMGLVARGIAELLSPSKEE